MIKPDRCVVTVATGRGFLVCGNRYAYIITAAHCLPHLPPAHPFSRLEERTYANLIGPLGGPPTVWAECLFADPVADLAILCEPDSQALGEQYEDYADLIEDTENREPLDIDSGGGRNGYVLNLEGDWVPVKLTVNARSILVAGNKVPFGASGSPILDNEGNAIGVISTGSLNPKLTAALPGWALDELFYRLKDRQRLTVRQRRAALRLSRH